MPLGKIQSILQSQFIDRAAFDTSSNLVDDTPSNSSKSTGFTEMYRNAKNNYTVEFQVSENWIELFPLMIDQGITEIEFGGFSEEYNTR